MLGYQQGWGIPCINYEKLSGIGNGPWISTSETLYVDVLVSVGNASVMMGVDANEKEFGYYATSDDGFQEHEINLAIQRITSWFTGAATIGDLVGKLMQTTHFQSGCYSRREWIDYYLNRRLIYDVPVQFM